MFRLREARRVETYGELASRFVDASDRKWVQGERNAGEPLWVTRPAELWPTSEEASRLLGTCAASR
jgi:hypothetical protein